MNSIFATIAFRIAYQDSLNASIEFNKLLNLLTGESDFSDVTHKNADVLYRLHKSAIATGFSQGIYVFSHRSFVQNLEYSTPHLIISFSSAMADMPHNVCMSIKLVSYENDQYQIAWKRHDMFSNWMKLPDYSLVWRYAAGLSVFAGLCLSSLASSILFILAFASVYLMISLICLGLFVLLPKYRFILRYGVLSGGVFGLIVTYFHDVRPEAYPFVLLALLAVFVFALIITAIFRSNHLSSLNPNTKISLSKTPVLPEYIATPLTCSTCGEINELNAQYCVGCAKTLAPYTGSTVVLREKRYM